ncbi:50S ribosomal protein L27 [Candidatus Collierbacteria bacterium]|nr:50S ribosomal protein L27 [Candidatus Collierbacteria bacterium]
MAHTKAGGKTRQHKQRAGKRLGVKKFGGEKISNGQIILRQRGMTVHPGKNVSSGGDYTLFAKASGKVEFLTKKGKSLVAVTTEESL